jgi:hypothetical protein
VVHNRAYLYLNGLCKKPEFIFVDPVYHDDEAKCVAPKDLKRSQLKASWLNARACTPNIFDMLKNYVKRVAAIGDKGEVENATKMALRTRLLKKTNDERSRDHQEGSGLIAGAIEERAGEIVEVASAKNALTGAAANGSASGQNNGTKMKIPSKTGLPIRLISDEERERTKGKIINDHTTILTHDLHNAIIDQSGEPLSEEEAQLLEGYIPIDAYARKDFTALKYVMIEDFIMNSSNFEEGNR